MSSTRLIYLHVPKAAGRTFISLLRRRYRRSRGQEVLGYEGSLVEAPPFSREEMATADLLLGHFCYGIHAALPGTSTYVTILREPVARVLSLYRYIASKPDHPVRRQVGDIGLLDFVCGDVDVEEIENGQTRQIGGSLSMTPDGASLERAKQHLRTFGAVGVVDRFDESLVLMRRAFGWSPPFYEKKNVGTVSVEPGAELDEAVGIIRERNRLDAELFRCAGDLMDERRRTSGSLFGAELALFESLNRAAGTIVPWVRARRGRPAA